MVVSSQPAINGDRGRIMGLTLKNEEVERLADEVAKLAGESKTQAIREALRERKTRLAFHVAPGARKAGLQRFLEREIWPAIPAELLGLPHDDALDDEFLGYGPHGI
jgi:antitoxin VapB